MLQTVEHSIQASTKFCAVLGHPVRHSASPAMQNAGIQALGLDWRYLAYDVHPEQLKQAIAGAKAMKFIGLNLTVPHKILAMTLVDELDGSARLWGAVNTIRFEAQNSEGDWRPLVEFVDVPREIRAQGFNTDAEAITRSLREDLGVELRGAKVILVGLGGAGRTAALKLASEGVGDLYLINRTESKTIEAQAEIQQRYPGVKVHREFPSGEVDLLVNATSLGLRQDDPLPFEPAAFSLRQVRAAYDMIYRPAETPFLALAKQAGCRTANGLGMLLWQGVRALEIWSGATGPSSVMRQALEKNIYG